MVELYGVSLGAVYGAGGNNMSDLKIKACVPCPMGRKNGQ